MLTIELTTLGEPWREPPVPLESSPASKAGSEGLLHGLVVVNTLERQPGGMNRSIEFAAPHLTNHRVHLHFIAGASLYRLLRSLDRVLLGEQQYLYDFVLFNSLASLTHLNPFGYVLGRVFRALRIPIIIYWHETDWVFNELERERPIDAARVDRLARHSSTMHLTASDACSDTIIGRYPSARPVVVNECSLVPAPFDRPVLPSQPPVVVNAASIKERKGTDLFVKTAIGVCQQHPTVEFLWFGTGAPYGSYETDIEAAGFQERIMFPGYVDPAYPLLRRASVLFLSSRDDPFPLAVLDGMCLGRTIVAFDIGGPREALGGFGILIEPFDTDAAAEAILVCLSKPADRLVNHALRQRYLNLYTPEQFAIRFNTVVRGCLKR
jgi:glycosyltransferase involved in cell wall biosynthesis